MSREAHTAGPWELRFEDKWPYCMVVLSSAGEIVTIGRYAYSSAARTLEECRQGVGFTGDERDGVVATLARQEADARLIAAAPALLEALRQLDAVLDFSEPGSEGKPLCFEDWSAFNDALDSARAAIHSATGEG